MNPRCSKILHIHPPPQHVALAPPLRMSYRDIREVWGTGSMQDPGCGLRRMFLPRTPVNKGLEPLLPHPVAGLPLVHAGMGLTAPGGVAVPGSSAPPSSSCLWSLRERCFGPAHTTTATATAHHTAASSHDCLTESAPEKASGEMKLPETVLNMAWKSMTISTLPPVPLYTHVSTSVQARMITMSHPPICPVATTNGRCHRAHTAPRIRLATSAERPACSLGRANPLQPGSSHVPPAAGIRSTKAKVEKRPVQPPRSAAEGAWAPSRTFSAVTARAIPTGSKSATAYHLIPTRQRTIRRSRPPIPLLPWVMASTTSAARKGPKEAMGAGERPKAYRIQGHHESAKASTKNAMSGCRFTKDTVHLLPCRVTGS